MAVNRKYSKSLKEKTVNLSLNGDKSNTEIEKEFDISRGLVARWVREFKKDEGDAFPGKGRVTGKNLEIQQLKRRVAELEERELILKKAMGIFSGQIK